MVSITTIDWRVRARAITMMLMPTSETPSSAVLSRLERTPGEVARAISAAPTAALATRPDPHSWSATEIVCHLRDVEELFQSRFHTILAIEEPTILAFGGTPNDLRAWRIGGPIGHPLDPDRWAAERQYIRNDAHEALAALQRRRREVITVLSALSPTEWQRGGVHPSQGRLPLVDWVARLAAHDDNHLDQLRRAIDGRA
jgi:hypothetical protein